MFGISFQEIFILAIAGLIILGPQKLPGALKTLGKYIRKLRRLTTEVRQQSGIDDVLREEGFSGGLNELRSVMRGGTGWRSGSNHLPPSTNSAVRFVPDLSREFPVEGPDSYDVLPEDLLHPNVSAAPAIGTGALPSGPAPSENGASAREEPLNPSMSPSSPAGSSEPQQVENKS